MEETDSDCKAKNPQKNARVKKRVEEVGTIISSCKLQWQHQEQKKNHESGNIRNRCSLHLRPDRGAGVAAASPSKGFPQ